MVRPRDIERTKRERELTKQAIKRLQDPNVMGGGNGIMAEIGCSDFLIVPKFESKLSDTINKELGVASKSERGRRPHTGHCISAQGFSGGFAQAGHCCGAVSSYCQPRHGFYSSTMSAQRFRVSDTLTLYPCTMCL